MENIPKISVITPVYNNEKYLLQCIESILSQMFKDFEFIIVDDGSEDGTSDILQEYAKKDPRIRIVKNDKNRGQAYSMNAGFKETRANFIAVMDSDDIAKPQRLERQLNFLETNKEYGGCGSFQVLIDENGDQIEIKDMFQEEGEVKDLMHNLSNLSHSTCMFRREVFERTGGYRDAFKRAQDIDLFLRVSREYKIYNIPELLLEHRISIDRATMKDRKKQMLYVELARRLALQREETGEDVLQGGDMDSFQKLKREIFGLQWQPRWMETSSNYLYWAHRMYHRGPIEYAKKLIRESVKYNPLNLKAWFYMLFLCSNETVRKKLTDIKRLIAGEE
jgi:glycosyltransferase involved in cell wall biosynthesis